MPQLDSDPVRILLVDDESLMRAGLKLLLDGAENLQVVGEAADGAEAAELAGQLSPDVVLMDIRMPRVDGIEGCRLVRELPQPPEVLMLTAFDTDSFILDALEETAAGRSTVSPQVLSRLIAVATAQGRRLGTPEARPGSVSVSDGEQLSSQGSAPRPQVGSGPGLDVLSAREREIAEAVARGLTNSEIAEEMFLSITTVKTHVASIFAKLEVTNRVQVAIRVLGA